MDINDLRGFITALTMLAFIGFSIFAWRRYRHAEFDESASVGLEGFVVVWAAWTLWTSSAEPVETTREWAQRQCVGSVTALLAWAPLTVVGAWVVAMAVEDAVAVHALEAARPLGWLVALVVGWRLGWSGIRRVTTRTPVPESRLQGAWAALPVLLVAGLALRHGLPIHGWWP